MICKRHRPVRSRRRGLASVLAMLFLVLFATLAVGFAAATSMNGQISRNERALQIAEAAADGGMQFMRYQLGTMTLPDGPQPTDGALLTAVASALGTQMNGTANMTVNGSPRLVTITGSGSAQQICIPSPTEWITLDQTVGTRFRAMIYAVGPRLVVTVDGGGPASTSVAKAIQVQFQEGPKAGVILDYGVATKGMLTTSGSTTISGLTDKAKGSVISTDMTDATPVTIDGQLVSGVVSVVNPQANIAVGASSQIGGKLFGANMPTFPTVDTRPFTAYAKTAYVPGSNVCNNCYIPPNANPTFTGGAQINGVMWVQPPNLVSLKGNTTVNGVIVSTTDTTDPTYLPFNASQNVISIAGTVTATPLSGMSTSNPAYNANLVKLTGSFMLAPTFAVSMTGNFGTVSGSIVVGQLSMSGNASGTVQGSVIGMQSAGMALGGNSSITISSTGTTNFPSGMSFGNNYTPCKDTYTEVEPW